VSEATIIDYGVGNLYSVTRAVERVGGRPKFVDTPAGIDSAHHLILPGVGAFGAGMAGLRDRGLVEAIRRYAASGRPLLGICLGMQMLLERSHEFGLHEGLGLIPGEVVRVELPPAAGGAKIPHVGWSALLPTQGTAAWRGTALDAVQPGEHAYFVHSYSARPSLSTDLLAHICYGEIDIAAVVGRGKVIGCQFHPEKSGPTGLKIIERFLGIEQSTRQP
jgi:glutamine amidotransferase